VANVEIVRMRDCRTEHEARTGHSFEFDRRMEPAEYGQPTYVVCLVRCPYRFARS
jgi:hypothetical protein